MALAGFVDILNAGLSRFTTHFLQGPGTEDQGGCPGLLQAVEQAHREWEAAKLFFETVSDPDLVDYAIHQIQAAQKRYTYLLRRAKEEGIRVEE